MTSPRITLTYSGGQAVVDPWWVRLEQENLPDDTATLSDAATLLDTLYQLDPCADEQEIPPDPAAEEVTETGEITVDRTACRFDADGNIDVDLRVIRSSQIAPYKLALQGGELQTTETIREPITRVVQIDSADRHTLDYPVVDGFTAEWRGAVYGSQGRIEAPAITRSGNTLAFAEEVKRGSIAVSYLTEYDRCTVTILGVDGEPGECTARVFFHGLVDELQLEIPEAAEPIGACTARWVATPVDYQIDCYREVTISTRCQCTDKEVRTLTYEESVPCPEEVVRCQGVATECRHLVGSVTVPEYVECADDREIPGRPGTVYALSTAKYYEDHCCKPPTFPLPQCPEKIITHRGGLPLKAGSAQYYNIWGPKLRITPISPPDGICGNWTIRQETVFSSCCDGVPPLAWNNEVSPDVIAPNSRAVIAVTGGGVYPFEWTIEEGHGFQFANQTTRYVTTSNQVYLVALPIACGGATITVTDGCSTIQGSLRCSSGKWELLGEFSPIAVYDPPARGFFAITVNDGGGIVAGSGDRYAGRYCLAAGVPGANTPWPWARWVPYKGSHWAACTASHVGETITDPIVGAFAGIVVPVGAAEVGDVTNQCPGDTAYWYGWLGAVLRVYDWVCP